MVADEAAYNIALADAWGITPGNPAPNNGQYQSSGRWYYYNVYVGDESAYNAAVATANELSDYNTWLASVTTPAQFSSSGVHNGQWAYNGAATDHQYVPTNNANWTTTYHNTPDWQGVPVYDENNDLTGYDTSSPTVENGGLTADERTIENGGLIYA